MLRIRLRRTGRSKQPSYRLVVADQRAPRDGDFVEIVGHYNPRTKEKVLNGDRIQYWISNGAQPTETVHRMLFAEGLTTVEPPKRPTKQSKTERDAQATAEREAQATAEKAAADAAAAASAEAAAAEAAAAEASTEEAPAADKTQTAETQTPAE